MLAFEDTYIILFGSILYVVYFRPKYLKFRERDPNEFRLASILRALDITDRLSILSTILSKEWWQTLRSNRDVSDGACCEPIASSGILV